MRLLPQCRLPSTAGTIKFQRTRKEEKENGVTICFLEILNYIVVACFLTVNDAFNDEARD